MSFISETKKVTAEETLDDDSKSLSQQQLQGSIWEDGLEVIESLLKSAECNITLTERQQYGLKSIKTMLLSGTTNNAENHIPLSLLMASDEGDTQESEEISTTTSIEMKAHHHMRNNTTAVDISSSSRSCHKLQHHRRHESDFLLAAIFGGHHNTSIISSSSNQQPENDDATNNVVIGKNNSMKQILAAHKMAKKLKSNLDLKRREIFVNKSNTTTNNQDGGDGNTYLPSQWYQLNFEIQIQLQQLLSWDNLKRWDFDIFKINDLLKGKNVLLFVAWSIIASPQAQYSMDTYIAKQQPTKSSSSNQEQQPNVIPIDDRDYGYQFMNHFNIKQETMIDFLSMIESKYNKDIPYHTHVHAADVTQTVHSLLQMGGIQFGGKNLLISNNEKFDDGDYHHDDDDASTSIELYALLVAAIVHDVGHPGTNNLYHVNAKTDLAIRYNDQSVLENYHAAMTFEIILGKGQGQQQHSNKQLKNHLHHDNIKSTNILESFTPEQQTMIRSLIIKTILGTDMTKHFAKKNVIKGMLLDIDVDKDSSTQRLIDDVTSRHEILSFILHLADISNPAKPIDRASLWADRVLEEFFIQGDKEIQLSIPISPLCDRKTTNKAQSQLGFINYIVLPSYEVLSQLIPKVESEILPKLRENMNYWQERLEVETKEQ